MEHLDFYGTSYSLNTLGKSSYKTVFSFLSSMITLTLVGIGAWLMGRDFFFKLNPKVINSTVIPDESEPVFINNRNFTFAFTIEDNDGQIVSEDNSFAFPHFYYEILKRDTDGSMKGVFRRIYTPVRCSSTEATQNVLLKGLKLDSLSCIDINQIKTDLQSDKDIALYGGSNESHFSVFYIIFSNCKYKDGKIQESTCISYKEATRRNSKFQFFSYYTAKTAFRPEIYDNPVTNYYDHTYHLLKPQSSATFKLRYSLLTLNDDRGWIFEDIKQNTYVNLTKEEKETGSVTEEDFKNNLANFLIIDLSFERKQLRIKRVYTKIQELVANLGGIMKFIFFSFSLFNNIYSSFVVDSVLFERYFKANIENSFNSSDSRINPSNTENNKSEAKHSKISLLEYLKIKSCCSKGLEGKKRRLDLIYRYLDVESVLKVCAKSEINSNSTVLIPVRRPSGT